MKNENIYSQKLHIFARRSLASGVKPIQTLLTPVFEPDFGDVIAYRAELKINSVVSGALGANDYLSPQLSEDLSVKFALRSVRKAVAAYAALADKNLPCAALFVRCPVGVIYSENAGAILLAELSGAAQENELDMRELSGKICLEFDSSAMDADGDTLSRAFAEIRSAAMKIAVDGLGGENFALEKLLAACPDYAFTSARLNAVATDTERRGALAPVVNLVSNLGGKVVAEGIGSDEELREYRSREIFGFLPNKNYAGRLNVRLETRLLETVVGEGEESSLGSPRLATLPEGESKEGDSANEPPEGEALVKDSGGGR